MEIVAYFVLGAVHLMIALCLTLRHVTVLRWIWMVEVAMVAACAIAYFFIVVQGLSS